MEERCDKLIELREKCSPKETNNPLEILQASLECQKETYRDVGFDTLSEQEKKEFTDYCNKKLVGLLGEQLGELAQSEEFKQQLLEQNKAMEEYQQTHSPSCKKYLSSIRQFCPRAIEVEPSYISFENPSKALGPFGEILQHSGRGEKESCSWRVDIGADPMSAEGYLEGNSLVISISVYPTAEEATKQFSIMATQRKSMIDSLESCDGEVEKDFFYSLCSSTLNSPKGKIMKDIQMQRQKENLLIATSLNFAEGKESVCSVAQLKQLVDSI
jgi:hypothetical protein